jgi:hypothetical protein
MRSRMGRDRASKSNRGLWKHIMFGSIMNGYTYRSSSKRAEPEIKGKG